MSRYLHRHYSCAASKQVEDHDDTVKTGGETLRIDDGYAAQFANVTVSWKANDNGEGGIGGGPRDSSITVLVGQAVLQFNWSAPNRINGQDRLLTATRSVPLNLANPGAPIEEKAISYSFTTNLVNAMTINVEITCVRSVTNFAKWQVQAYQKIVERWQKLQDDFEGKMATDKIKIERNKSAGNG